MEVFEAYLTQSRVSKATTCMSTVAEKANWTNEEIIVWLDNVRGYTEREQSKFRQWVRLSLNSMESQEDS
jgi:hypothetical protein